MTEPALDSATIASLLDSVGGDREFLGELFATFIGEAPGLLESIEAAVNSGDSERLRHAAHTLKSTSASLGALKLSGLSAELEQAGRAGELGSATSRLPELRTLVESATAAMAAESQEA